MDQYVPINVCLPLLSAVVESLVAAEHESGRYDVHLLLHGIDRHCTGTFCITLTPKVGHDVMEQGGDIGQPAGQCGHYD